MNSSPPITPSLLHADTRTSLEFVEKLAGAGFWGTISLKLEAGRITHIRQEENLKPSDLSGFPRVEISEDIRSTRR